VYKLQGRLGSEEDAERSDACSDTEEDEEKTNVKVSEVFSEVFCDLCEERHTAIYHCKDCSENLCESSAGIHKKGKATKGHLVLLLSDIEKEADVDESYEVPIYKEGSKWKITVRLNTSPKYNLVNLAGLEFTRAGEIHITSHAPGYHGVFSKTGSFIKGGAKLEILSILLQRDGDFYICDFFKVKEELDGKNKSIITFGCFTQDKIFTFANDRQLANKLLVYSKQGVQLLNFSITINEDTNYADCCSRIEVSQKGELFIADSGNNTVKVFSQEGKFLRLIGRSGEFSFITRYISNIKFSDKGEVFILDSKTVRVYSEEGKYLYCICKAYGNNTFYHFGVSPSSGDIIVVDSNNNAYTLEVTGKYTRKPKETHFTLNTTLVQDSEILKDTKVSSVTFPISIKRDANDNLFTRTLYFREPIPVKQSIHEVEEYFRKRITREEFNQVRSVCNFSSLQGELRGDYMNWDTCKKAKVIRGYFLGGEIIDELRVDGGNLFIHITDCFITLK
jgi:WD40 repeat protein